VSNSSNTVCPVYLSSMLNNTFRKRIHNPRKIFGEYVKPGQTVADIGCGPGFFSIALAEMVGEEGQVLSVDLQPEMLAQVKANGERLNLQSRIVLTQCENNNLNIEQKVDFVLAFWMVHEVPDARAFFDNIVRILKPNGLFMMIEPKGHTSAEQFQTEIAAAGEAGLKPCKEVKVSISRGILFSHPEP
jgi:ubiquinone/menaquinone biosynthesis C-methylase UbiE